MFTGIIEDKGKIEAVSVVGGICQLVVSYQLTEFSQEALGNSIAINGCCLTITTHQPGAMVFDVSSETLEVTNLDQLSAGDQVNLERALSVGQRLGGHLVSGHIDSTGQVATVTPLDDGWELVIKVPKEFSPLLIDKGSLCIDGVSLTINRLVDKSQGSHVHLMIIPETLKKTTVGDFKASRQVNLEFDMLAKFIQRQARFQ